MPFRLALFAELKPDSEHTRCGSCRDVYEWCETQVEEVAVVSSYV